MAVPLGVTLLSHHGTFSLEKVMGEFASGIDRPLSPSPKKIYFCCRLKIFNSSHSVLKSLLIGNS
jgi:hypothetical protein